MDAIKIVVKSIAPKVKVVYDPESETCFDHDLKAVIIGDDFRDDDYGFMRHIKYNHNFAEAYDYSINLWSILHELGHYFVGDNGYVSEEELAQYAICAMMPHDVAKDNPYLQNLYFDIPAEYNATEWAITWIMKHRKLAKIFNELVK